MCGIVGIIARSGVVAPDVLERATQSLAHRGPDDSGTVILRGTAPGPAEVGLGNRRLAVLDTSPLGHQPMHDPENGNWIVYNGEVYNFRQLRGELEQQGVAFQSGCDTEVVLKAYGCWGPECLSCLRGMFAFAIWDAGQQQLFLARDPMGIKPLYYCDTGTYFGFASELRALLTSGLVPPKLDPAGLLTFLTFGSCYEPLTMISGISTLAPGHYLTWKDGAARQALYWSIPAASPRPLDRVAPASRRLSWGRLAPKSSQVFPRQQDAVAETLHEAITMQMVSDVPVGIFLSGGIDSSSLVAVLSRGGAKLNTFSLGFREPEYDESRYSRIVAQAFRTNHREILISQQDAFCALDPALRAMDQPTIDGLNSFLICHFTRAEGIKVVLSGLGGDELFAGYSTFRTVPRMESLADICGLFPKAARNGVAVAFASATRASDRNRKLAALVRGNGSMVHPYFLSRMLFTPHERDGLLASCDPQASQRASTPLLEYLLACRELDAINRVSYLETRGYMLNTLLRDSDCMSMAHGLELRVPFVDHRLAERLFAIPGDRKMNGTPKHMLLKAAGIDLPPEVVHRRKRGFTLPLERWLRDNLRREVENTLDGIADGPLGCVFNPVAVRRVWDDFLGGRTSWSRPWSLYVLQRWCEVNSVAA